MPENPLQRQVGGTHYVSKIQHVEFCQINRIPWCEAAAIKYIARHRKKNGKEDVDKAIHYIELLIALDYGRRDEALKDMDPRKFQVSIKDFCDANKITGVEADAIMQLCWHQQRGEHKLHDTIKALRKLVKDYDKKDDYSLLD